MAPRKAVTPFLVSERWGYAPVGAWGRPELYDLQTDPLAEANLAADHRPLVSELHALFLAHLATHGASEAFRTLWQDLPDQETGGVWAIDYPSNSLT